MSNIKNNSSQQCMGLQQKNSIKKNKNESVATTTV